MPKWDAGASGTRKDCEARPVWSRGLSRLSRMFFIQISQFLLSHPFFFWSEILLQGFTAAPVMVNLKVELDRT